MNRLSRLPFQVAVHDIWASTNLPRAVAVVVQDGDRFLSVSRKDNPEAIGLPGGKVDQGESDVDAALRELKEETGIDAKQLYHVWSGVCDGGEGGVTYWTTTFWVTYDGSELSTQEEGDLRWVTREELEGSVFGEYNKKLFAVLDDTHIEYE